MTGVVCASALERLMDYLEGAVAADLAPPSKPTSPSCERCEAFVASYRATPASCARRPRCRCRQSGGRRCTRS
jgi:hypothetical protein